MAHRIHVTAVRNTTPEAVREALAPLGQVEVTTANGWCWFSSSVWGVSSAKIIEALQNLGGPLLLATTEDACRWYLQLRRKGLEPYVAVHEFPPCPQDESTNDCHDLDAFDDEGYEHECVELNLGAPPIPDSDLPPLEFVDPFFEPYEEDFDENFDEEEAYDESPLGELCEAYASLGLPLSESLVEHLRTVPEDQLHRTFGEIHAADMEQALERFGIPHDRQAVIDILCGRTVTPIEMDWDIGNLPRFLQALGLGPHFDKMVEEAEDQARELSAREPENFAQPILDAVADVETRALHGGPLSIPMEDAPLLFRAGYYRNRDMAGAFEALLPEGAAFAPKERVPSYLSVHQTSGRVEIGASTKDVFLLEKASTKLATILRALPDGAKLMLHLKSETVPPEQFRGFIREGQWHIESSATPLTDPFLARAIELFRAAHAKAPLMADNDDEAQAILEAAKSDLMLSDETPKREGLTLSVGSRYRDDLAILFFRHRFGHLWDCSAAILENKERFEQWREFNKSLEAEERLPITDRIVHEGRVSKFYETDMEAAARDEDLSKGVAKLPALSKALAALGFEHLGNIVCEKVGKCVICGFVNEEEEAFVTHYVAAFGLEWNDCYTPFEDGTSLTTTTGVDEGSIAKLRVLKHRCESKAPGKLIEAHRKGREILQDHGIVKARVDPTMEGLARAIDEFLAKRLPEE